jgi:hypothetical protein
MGECETVAIMAKLDNHERAWVSLEKLTAYCLNEQHPNGKEKATTFKLVLGIGVDDAEVLRQAILKGVFENDCQIREQDEYGTRYTVIMKIRIFEKDADITTGWIIRTGEDYPRLTSCYIKRRKK